MKYFNSTAFSIATVVFVFLVLVRIFNISYIEHKVVNLSESSELSVVGEGKVDVVPDTATVDAGITVSRAATAETAKNQISKVNNAIIESLKNLGIKKEDIKTSSFNIYPDYDYGNVRTMMAPAGDAETEPAAPDVINTNSRIAGYSGSANVTVKIRNKELVTQVIQKVTDAGANSVSGARFTVDNPEKFREEARNKAITNAKEQAKKLSKSLGITLGRVTNFIESDGGNPYYDRGVMMSADAKAGTTSPIIEEGTQTISTSVTLFFERK